MKPGRPRYHQKARWLTIDGPGSSQYYLLDEHGNLVLIGGRVTLHHTVDYCAPRSRPAASERKPFPVPVFTVPDTKPNQCRITPMDVFSIAFEESEDIHVLAIECDDPEAMTLFDA
jgi:hypothetical protein